MFLYPFVLLVAIKLIANKDKTDKLKREVEKFVEKCNDSCLLKCLKLTPRCIDNKCQP